MIVIKIISYLDDIVFNSDVLVVLFIFVIFDILSLEFFLVDFIKMCYVEGVKK